MTATATRATATVTRAGVQHAVGQIIELSAQTLAAGQARIDRHASGHISRQAEVQSLRVIHAAQGVARDLSGRRLATLSMADPHAHRANRRRGL